MKKLIQLTLLLLALLLPATAAAQYYDFSYHGIYYRMCDYETVSVVGYESGYWDEYGNYGEVTIPSRVPRWGYSEYYDDYDYCTVTSIEYEAFHNYCDLRRINLPSTITEINYGAFRDCSNLEAVSFSYSEDCSLSIHDDAFEGCSSLTSIELPSSLTYIGGWAFAFCSSLTSITIPSSVTDMGYNAFYGCTSLSNVYCYGYIGESAFSGCSNLTDVDCYGTIGENAFSGCTKLTDAFIYSGTVGNRAFQNCTALSYLRFYSYSEQDSISIGNYAFQGCTALTSVEISSNVKSIGNAIFAGCNKLTSITVDSRNPRYDSRDNCKGIIETSSNTLVTTCKNTTIPGSVTTIGSYAYYSSSITSLSLPSSISTIADYAFNGCCNLSSITMPSVTTIGSGAFSGCTYLSNITMPNVTSIENNAFDGCKNISNLTLPSNLTAIGNSAFNGCTKLSSITIPNSVTTIGNNAFYGCSMASSATIGSSVSSIGRAAFGNCSKLSAIVVDGGNAYYDSRENCNAIIETSSNILVQGCKSTTIPNTVTQIGDSAFYYCSSLSGITIPSSVTEIGTRAFYYCTSLTSIVIPNSVTTIKDYAFAYSSSLSTVDLPNSISSIGTGVFYQTAWLGNQPNGVIYAGLIAYGYKGTMTSGTSITLREGTIGIAQGTFSGQAGLSSIYIPNSVTFIGDQAFSGCEWLSSVVIPDSVTTIGGSAFNNCYRLSELTIGNSVTTIGESAFQGCSALTSLDIPNSVTTIGGSAFQGCYSIVSVSLGNSIDSIGDYAFYPDHYDYDTWELTSALTSVHITDLDAWFNISFANEFSNPCNFAHHLYVNGEELHDLVVPGTVTSIGNYAFIGCKEVTSVTIPNSVTSIGYSAFNSCLGLTSIEIPASVTSIGNYAFINCTGLKELKWNAVNCATNGSMSTSNLERITIGPQVETIPSSFAYSSIISSITIPNSVTSIGSGAFNYCSSLRSVFFNAKNCTTNGLNVFYGTNNVNYLQFGDSVENIPAGLPSINMTDKKLVLPNSVKTIEAGAFKGSCAGVVLGNSIENLVTNSFPSGMKIAYTDRTEPSPCESGAFASPHTLYVPTGCRIKYFTAPGWSEFANIVEGQYVRADSIVLAESVAVPRTYTRQLNATIMPSDASATTVNWKSDDSSIATVSSTGLITAVAEGETDIIAYVDNTLSICHVTVTPIYVTGITLSDNTLSMNVDDMTSLTATASPNDAENKELEWIIPENDVLVTLQVNNNKLNIGAIKEGQVTITVRATDGSDVSATCEIYVTSPIPVTQLSIVPEQATLYIGESQQLNATILPDNASNKTLTWSTNNSDVASVDQNGLVTALAVGNATITATTNDGSNLMASCAVTVETNVVLATSIALSQSSAGMNEGETLQLTAIVMPEDATDKTVTWASSDAAIATVNQNGLVTAVAPGSATITASTVDGSELTASCVVTVEPNVVLATLIELNQTSAGLNVGETLQLTAIVMPEDATDKSVTWTSSDAAVATVDQNGLVTAEAPGTATIIASTVDGSELTATCEVTVNGTSLNNSLDADALTVYCSEEKTLAVSMNNESSITAVQCDIYLPEGISIATEDGDYLIDMVPARMGSNHVVSTNDLPNGAIRLFITSATSKPFKGNSGDLFILNLVVADDATSGDYSLDLRNVILSDTEAHPYYAPDLSVPVTIRDYIKGDVNSDRTVNVADYVATANFILELDTHPFLFAAGDIDENGTINVSDLVGVANIALNYMGAPAINRAPAMGYESFGLMTLAADGNTLAPNKQVVTLDLSNSSAVTAFQMDIALPDGMKLVGANLSGRATASHTLEMAELANGAYRLLGSSMMSKPFAGNEGALLTLEIEGAAIGDAVIDGIMLAEPNTFLHTHDAMILSFDATGVHEVRGDVRIYTENGMVVVESPMASKVYFILPNGMSVMRDVKPGRNVYSTGQNGIVIVKVGDQVKKFRL